MIEFQEMSYLPSKFVDNILKKGLVKYIRLYEHNSAEKESIPKIKFFSAEHFPWSVAIREVQLYYVYSNEI